MNALKGYRTYLTVLAALVYIVGSKCGYWPIDNDVIAGIGLLAVGFLRAGLKPDAQPGESSVSAPSNPRILSFAAAAAVLFCFSCMAVHAAEGGAVTAENRSAVDTARAVQATSDSDVWRPGQFSISPFASYRVREFDGVLDRFGGGLAVGYQLTRNLTLEAETISEGLQPFPIINSIAEAGMNLKAYLPLGNTGLAPYGLLGYTHGFKPTEENRMNAGAGLELRANKYFAVFADGRWTHDFRTLGHALFRVGGSVRF